MENDHLCCLMKRQAVISCVASLFFKPFENNNAMLWFVGKITLKFRPKQ